MLVDPVLAEDARRALPNPPDCLSRLRTSPAPRDRRSVGGARRALWPSGPPHANASAGIQLERPAARLVVDGHLVTRPEPRAPRQRPSLLGILAALFIAFVVGSPALDLLPFGSAQSPTLAGESPEGAAPVTLEWPSVGGASVYNLVLWREGRRVYDLWPEGNNVDVRAAVARDGKRLEPGTYQWFAFAGFGSRDDLRFGKAIANGTFTIE